MKKFLIFFSYLFLLSCLGQISSDIYLPALPTIREHFQTSNQWVQLSLAIFMIGFSLSHLIYGPVSDGIGRKKPLISGICVCLIGSFLCRYSAHFSLFMMGRALQGIGAGAGAALFLSILRDVYDGNALAKISSFLGISRVILLASAPLIGSYLLRGFGWQSCFTFLIFYACICLLGSIFLYKETNKHPSGTVQFSVISKNIVQICRHPFFLRYVFCVMLAFGGILAWLTTVPFLLQDVVGLTPLQFGWVSALAGLFFIVGGLINALLVEQFGLEIMLMVGLWIMLLASLVMLCFGLIDVINVTVIMLPVIIYIVGSSFIFSNAYAGAMNPFSNLAGTAAALFGFLQILGGAVSSTLMSLFHADTQIPLSLVLMSCSVIALLINRKASNA